jgi:predicted esterase
MKFDYTSDVKALWPRWCVYNHANEPTSCILALPGRAQSGFEIARWYSLTGMTKTLIVGITPMMLEWYPMPNGADDQADAVRGQTAAVRAIKNVLEIINERFGFDSEKVALVGWSAGAVMAIKAVTTLQKNFAAVVSHGGAILEPHLLPKSGIQTPIHLLHNRDDETFNWPERFLPMKRSLKSRGYNVKTAERNEGGHGVQIEDIVVSGSLIAPHLGYEKDFGEKNFGDDMDIANMGVYYD